MRRPPSRIALIAPAALGLALAAPGCRSLSLDSRANRASGPVLDEATQDAIAAINENARAVKSLEARASIDATVPGRFRQGHLSGKLLMQRPRDFKLSLRTAALGGEIANIGSNSDGFWFWVQDRDDPTIKFCKYDRDGRVPADIPIIMQPDWIVEALGLREIPEDEAKSMKAVRGELPGTIVLRGRRPAGGGQFLTSETVLKSDSMQVVSHQILAPDRRTVLVRADLGGYGPVGDAPGAPVLAHQAKLSWVREGISLDVGLSKVKANQPIPDAESVFAEYQRSGVGRRDLATLVAGDSGPATTVRESRPSPPANAGPRVNLGRPAPLGDDRAMRTGAEATPIGPDLPGLPGGPAPEGLVTSPLPGAPAPGDAAATVTRTSRRPAWIGVDR